MGVRFVYAYKSLAHPELNGYVDPSSLEERLMHVAEAKKTLRTKFEWICDGMDNQLKKAFGGRPNSEFIIDPEGKLVVKRQWSDPAQTRRDLEFLVGEPDKVTRPSEIDAGFIVPERNVASGIISRIQVPSGMRALVTRSQPLILQGEKKNFVKLQARSEDRLISNGSGSLYLGFFVDPIHRVHWNNLTDPPRFALEYENQSGEVEKVTGEAPRQEHPADSDPREFLIELNEANLTVPVKIKLNYYACDDAETFCLPVTQEYLVELKVDREAGRPISEMRNRFRGQRNPGNAGSGRQPRENPARILEMLKQADSNGDGFIDWVEAPVSVRQRFSRIDLNEDFSIDQEEVEMLRNRIQRSR